MLLKPALIVAFPALVAVYFPTCAAPIKPTIPPEHANLAELWQDPKDIATRDLYGGAWGADRAPNPTVVYHYVKKKEEGTNPGVTVKDPENREWHVKQPPKNNEGAEGPIEVTLSRILWAVGYHQPPEYFLEQFTLADERQAQPGESSPPIRMEPGGRFRLEDGSIKKIGIWSWQQNPFVNTHPYQGLLVILMMFNSSDIKNDNNTMYEVHKAPSGDDVGVKTWYVVRDLGTALGETGRLTPKRGDPDLFDKIGFVTGVEHGFVKFGDYHGWHQELVKNRITTEDVRWACELLSRLTDRQWADAFRAGGYEPALAQRFITRVHQKIRQGLQLDQTGIRVTER